MKSLVDVKVPLLDVIFLELERALNRILSNGLFKRVLITTISTAIQSSCKASFISVEFVVEKFSSHFFSV